MVMGFMLWTPEFIPKGCFINEEEGHQVVRCSDHDSLHRAVSLVNILFSWFVIGVTGFGVAFYLGLVKVYGEKVKYVALGEKEEEEEESDDMEKQKRNILGKPNSFIHVAKSFEPVNIER